MAGNLAGQRATCLLFLSGLEAVVLQDADGHGLDGISCWLGPDGRPERAMREAIESATGFAVTKDDLHWLGTITRPVGNNLDDREKTSEAHHFYAVLAYADPVALRPGAKQPVPVVRDAARLEHENLDYASGRALAGAGELPYFIRRARATLGIAYPHAKRKEDE